MTRCPRLDNTRADGEIQYLRLLQALDVTEHTQAVVVEHLGHASVQRAVHIVNGHIRGES